MAHELRAQYPAIAASSSNARRDLADYLDDFGVRESLPVASLLVSELVTNAVVHAQGPIELRAHWSGTELRVEVSDRGAGTAVPRPADFGRGLQIVAALASSWGIGGSGEDGQTAGHMAWFELTTE